MIARGSVTMGVPGLVLDSPHLIIVSRDAMAGTVTTIINGQMTKEPGFLTATLSSPTADFLVSGFYNSGVVQQIRGAVAAVVIQDSATHDENVADYLRAVYGVN